jgi:hypothetical protein
MCWPNLRSYNTHKLEFRSKQCALIAYNTHHKGYKCLDISTGRVYTSHDVVFDKYVFPFFKLHPNAGACLHLEISPLPANLVLSSSGGSSVATNHMPKSTDASMQLCSS